MNQQIEKQVALLSSQLRMLQTDLANSSDHSRQRHLKETIERTLSEVMPGDREAILKGLLLKFPAWNSHEWVPDRDEPNPGFSSQDRQDLSNPKFLVQRLIEVSESLPPAEKAEIRQQLVDAELVSHPEDAWPQEPVQRLRAGLGLETDQSIAPERLLDLVQLLSEMISSIEQVAWATWRNVVPRSALQRGEAIGRTMNRFLSGESQVTRSQVDQDLLKLRRLTAALIMALGRASEQFASGFMARLAPDHIEALVPNQLIPVFQEKMYWQKYKQLTADLNDSAIEKEIKQAIAQYVQSLMSGVGTQHP